MSFTMFYTITILIFTILVLPLKTNGLLPKLAPDDLRMGNSHAYGVAVLVVSLMFGSIIRAFVQNFQNPFPAAAFISLTGMIWGIAMHYMLILKYQTSLLFAHPDDILMCAVPVIIFKSALCIDAHTFLKSITQILVISTFGVIMMACFVGCLMTLLQNPNWSYSYGILFGTLCTPIYPTKVGNILKDVGPQTKYLAVLLEGESLLGLCSASIMFQIVKGIIEGYITEWYHGVAVTLKFILGGLLCGWLLGKISCWLINKVYNDVGNLLVISLIFPYLSFYICEKLLGSSGMISILVMGVMINLERSGFTLEVSNFLTNFWKILEYITTTIIYVTLGTLFSFSVLFYIELRDIALILVTVVVANVGRFLGYFVLAPILSRIGYGLSFRNMLMAVWSSEKNSISLVLLLKLYHQRHFFNISRELYMILYGLFLFTLFINVPITPALLRIMGLSQLSLARQTNMNNCMKFVLAKRQQCIAMLKIDRFLSDANWPIVNKTTNMKHPYQISFNTNEEDNFFISYKLSFCPECEKEVLHEPSPKEFREMTREARLRVLKAKKVSYSRQYEYGMVSKDGIRILNQAVEVAMDTEKAIIELDGLHKLFQKQSYTNKCTKTCLDLVFKKTESKIQPPKKYWRRICYRIIIKRGFLIFIYTSIAINMIPVILDFIYDPDYFAPMGIAIVVVNSIFFFIYLSEFILKIYGYSYIYICKHGFKTYFSSVWNVVDFFVLLAAFADFVVDILFLVLSNFRKTGIIGTVAQIARSFIIIRLFKFVHLCKAFYPNLMKYYDSKIDHQMAFAYDVGKGYVAGEEEVLEMLPNMVDNKAIRDDIRNKMENDRLSITKELGMVQKNRPWIAITVKTQQAIKTALNVMLDAINELKISGWVDDVEYLRLMDSLNERHKIVRSIKSIQPSSPRVIFNEVPWMAQDEEVAEFLYQNVYSKIFDPGDKICVEGQVSEGIYIIVTGLFLLTYKPKPEVLNETIECGLLPIIDYITSNKFDKDFEDYIVSGNCIGELSTITGRPYNCTIVAETHSQVYVLHKDVLYKAIEMNPDPVNGLECKIWKSISIRLAISMLTEVPAYQSTNKNKIKYALERAFVPNLSNYKMFVVNDMMEDIILLEGVVVDFNTRDVFIAPCYIPRTVQKLIFPKSSAFDMNTSTKTKTETKLLIIPTKEVDEYDIMEKEEEIAEMVPVSSSKCLQHLIQNKLKRKRKPRMLNLGDNKRREKKSFASSKSAVFVDRSGLASQHEIEVENVNINDHTSPHDKS